MIVSADRPYQFRLLADGLLGYAWPKWVRTGEQAEFRVHSVEAYKIDLWRYGENKEHVAKIGWFDEHGPLATMQITPDGDYTETGVAWNKVGYGSWQHAQYVTAPDRSGLYYFHVRTDSGRFFAFPWIVAPSSPQSRVAVLASNITWNAYNNFGGRSNYIHADRLPLTPTVNARIELPRYNDPEFGTWNAEQYLPLSFDRPEPINHVPEATRLDDPIEGRAACHVAPTEWRLLGWLERSGFDYDLYAETQLHAGQLDLDQYRVLVISTHPEYWSRAMYQAVKTWVNERGGRLMYLGGNGLNCEVSLSDDGATMIAHNGDNRVLQANLAQYESRFGMRVESEANLLGVVYTETGVMTAAPYRVDRADHWIFSGTGVKNGDLFGGRSQHERHPRRRFGPRDRQDLTQLARRHAAAGQGPEPQRRRRRDRVLRDCQRRRSVLGGIDLLAQRAAGRRRRGGRHGQRLATIHRLRKTAPWQTRRQRLNRSPTLPPANQPARVMACSVSCARCRLCSISTGSASARRRCPSNATWACPIPS